MKRSLPTPPARSVGNSRSSGTEDRESGWNSNITERLPVYNSESDPYNKFTRTDKYAKHMKRQHKLEQLDKKSKMKRSQSITALSGGMKPMEGNSLSMMKDGKGAKLGKEGKQVSFRSKTTRAINVDGTSKNSNDRDTSHRLILTHISNHPLSRFVICPRYPEA